MLNNVKIRPLKGFLIACQSGSFVTAAKQMHVTPSAFSQMIRELEETLGMLLFERTTRQMALTDAGRLLQARVKRPIDELDDVYTYFQEMALGDHGSVMFSALPSIAFDIGANTMGAMHARSPRITIRLIEDQQDNIIKRVLDREVDFGFGMNAPNQSELLFEPVLDDELVVILPRKHPFESMQKVRWQDLIKSPLILLPRTSGARQVVEARLTLLGKPHEPIHEVINMVTALNMVKAGFGLTVQPQLALTSLKMQGLIFRRIGPPAPRRQLGIIRRADRPLTPVASTVARELINESAKPRFDVLL